LNLQRVALLNATHTLTRVGERDGEMGSERERDWDEYRRRKKWYFRI